MRRRNSIIFAVAAMLIPVVVFGLPVLAAVCIGAERTDRLARWMAAQGHVHGRLAGYDVPAFSLIDQQSQPVTRELLNGHVWIASFFFSRCAGTCPMTSTKMAMLQKQIPNHDVLLVSFSMDPERDTPMVLAEYAQKFHADPARWHMLTGDRKQMDAIVNALCLSHANDQRAQEVIHSDRFVLIDRDGRARGEYDSSDQTAIQRLASDAQLLAASR